MTCPSIETLHCLLLFGPFGVLDYVEEVRTCCRGTRTCVEGRVRFGVAERRGMDLVYM